MASYVAQATCTCHLQTCILANLLSVFAPLREIFIGIGARPRVVPGLKIEVSRSEDQETWRRRSPSGATSVPVYRFPGISDTFSLCSLTRTS